MLKDYLDANKISMYKCSKEIEIPYTTVRELSLGITPVEKTNANIVRKLARYCDLPMDTVYRICQLKMFDQFSIFRSEIQHKVKRNDALFVVNTVEAYDIDAYYACKKYAEAFYLTAMIDYISDKYNIKRIAAYNHIRKQKLKNKLYPQDVIIKAKVMNDDTVYDKIECNPYFLKYNIVEGEI